MINVSSECLNSSYMDLTRLPLPAKEALFNYYLSDSELEIFRTVNSKITKISDDYFSHDYKKFKAIYIKYKKITKSLDKCRNQIRSIQLIIDRHEENQKLAQTWRGYFDLKFSPKIYFEKEKRNLSGLWFPLYKKILLQSHELNTYLEKKHKLTEEESNLFLELNASDLLIESKSYQKYVENRKITKIEEAGTTAFSKIIQLLEGEKNYEQLPICDFKKLFAIYFHDENTLKAVFESLTSLELINFDFQIQDLLDRCKNEETPIMRGTLSDRREFFILIARDKNDHLYHDIFYQEIPTKNTTWVHKGPIIKCSENTQDNALIEQGKLNNLAYSKLENFIYNQCNDNYRLL